MCLSFIMCELYSNTLCSVYVPRDGAVHTGTKLGVHFFECDGVIAAARQRGDLPSRRAISQHSIVSKSYLQLVNYKSTSTPNNKMSTSDTKVNSLCGDNLEGCKLSTGKKISDEELFKQPPTTEEDCPICFLRPPTLDTGREYMSCCGKMICSGCSYAPVYDSQGNKVDNEKCPFCRTPGPDTEKEINERQMKRVEMNDPIAIFNTGCDYRDGTCGYPQDDTKALELYHRAAELGYAGSYVSIGYAYSFGEGVEVDKKKAIHYWKLAAMKGNAIARYNLGNMERRKGNFDRAIKHYTIAVRDGNPKSLESIKRMYREGHATKDDYARALQSRQSYLDEIKSDPRDKAAAADEDYKYY